MFKSINRELISNIPTSFFYKSYDLAVDITLVEYYGKDDNEYIIRSKAKNGTTKFYAYLTCYVIKENKRYTLYVKQLKKNYILVKELQQALDYINEYIIIKCLYLDSQFYNISCISYLKEKNYKYIMPIVIRGKKGNKLEKLIKSCKENKIIDYTISKDGQNCNVKLYVIHKEQKNKKGKIETLTFAYCVGGNPTTLEDVFSDYRTRFGIESSYRIMGGCCIKTVSNNPVLRFLFNAVAFLLINIWTVFKLIFRLTSKRKSKFVVMKIFANAIAEILIHSFALDSS